VISIRRMGGAILTPVGSQGQDELVIEAPDLGPGVHGDLVEYQVLRHRRGPRGRARARVVEVLVREPRRLAGITRRNGERVAFEPIQSRFPLGPLAGTPPEIRSGDRAVALLIGGRTPGPARYTFAETLGDPTDPQSDGRDVAIEIGLPRVFTPIAISEATARAREPIELGERTDLRALEAVTIDPEEAADFDDAVSWRRLPDGRDEVGVHIADVTHYVSEGGAVDDAARERGTSVYLPGLVLPMVPDPISSDAASLRPEVDRRAFSVRAVLGRSGQVESWTLERSLIRSRRRLTYAEAEAILGGAPPRGAGVGKTAEDELPWVVGLRKLGEITARFKQRRETRGGLTLDVPEYRVRLDELGRPLDLTPRRQGPAHRLVEELMLLANELTGGFGKSAGLPILYRIHERPRWERLLEFGLVLDELGIDHRGRNLADPQVLRAIVATAEERGIGELTSTYLLRSLEKARYSAVDRGHYGLGVTAYTHFTSPIRRYPDLHTHRVLIAAVAALGGGGEAERTQVDSERLLQPVRERYRPGLEALAEETSAREAAAQDAERIVLRIKALRLLLPYLGQEQDGMVVAALGSGMFVLLDEVPVDGFVRRENMPADRYDLGPRGHSLAGRRRGTRFALGQRVRVRIERISLLHRELDLTLVGGALMAAPKEGLR
jgi:ribonuclease R